MGLGEMTLEARMVQQDVIHKFGVLLLLFVVVFFFKTQISQILILRIKTVENEIKAKQ